MDRHDEFALADRFNWSQWKRIFKYVKPYNKHGLALMFAAVGTGVFDAVFVGDDAVVDDLNLFGVHTVGNHKVAAFLADRDDAMVFGGQGLVQDAPQTVGGQGKVAGINHLYLTVEFFGQQRHAVFTGALGVDDVDFVFLYYIGKRVGLYLLSHVLIIRCVTVTDVNIDVAIPIPNVTAKPLTGPTPK